MDPSTRSKGVTAMQDVTERLRTLEDRLERLLSSGWRTAAGEAEAFGQEASALEEAGLPELAARLRGVAQAASPAEVLPAITLAMAALRLLRARLAPAAVPPGPWAPLAGGAAERRAPRADRLLPISRLAAAGGEVWACVKLRGTQPDEVLFLEPPSLDTKNTWLRQPMEGRLRWLATHPLGAAGEVRLCALDEARWGALPEKPEDDPLLAFRESVGNGKLKEGAPAFAYGGPLRVEALDSGDLGAYVWPDPATREALVAGARGKNWALIWKDGAVVVPVALLQPGGLLWKGKLTHLVRGNPTDALIT